MVEDPSAAGTWDTGCKASTVMQELHCDVAAPEDGSAPVPKPELRALHLDCSSLKLPRSMDKGHVSFVIPKELAANCARVTVEAASKGPLPSWDIPYLDPQEDWLLRLLSS